MNLSANEVQTESKETQTHAAGREGQNPAVHACAGLLPEGSCAGHANAGHAIGDRSAAAAQMNTASEAGLQWPEAYRQTTTPVTATGSMEAFEYFNNKITNGREGL